MHMLCVSLFSRSPSFPLIQDTVLKGKLSVPELRVTRLMNRSISCTMKNPKGELFSYPPNSQVSVNQDNLALVHVQQLESVTFYVSILMCDINKIALLCHSFIINVQYLTHISFCGCCVFVTTLRLNLTLHTYIV